MKKFAIYTLRFAWMVIVFAATMWTMYVTAVTLGTAIPDGTNIWVRLSIRPTAKGQYTVYADDEEVRSGTWEEMRDGFIALLPDYEDQHEGIDHDWNTLCAYGEELKRRYLGKEG